MNNNNVYLLNNFDFLVCSFVRMQVEGCFVDIQVVIGNMDEEYCDWFCKCYVFYCQQVIQVKKLELEY